MMLGDKKMEKNNTTVTAYKKAYDKKEKSEQPLISVIVPVYNTEKYLGRCLESITANTYKNLEIICIDDGSTDNSLNILSFYKKKDARIKVINQNNLGPAAARNAGLDNATGKYISFVDSDDFVSWNAYEILTKVAEENKLDMIMFGANAFPENEAPDWIKDILNTQYHYYKNCDGCKLVFQEKSARPFLWLHFIKKSLFEVPTKIRFDETMKLGEDQLLQFQYVPRVKNAMVITDKLYNYRISRSGSLMQMYSSRLNKKVETHLLLAQKIIDSMKNENTYEQSEDMLVTWLVNFLYYSINHLPASWRHKYSCEIIELFKKNNIATYLISEWEQPRYQEMIIWSMNKVDEDEEIENLMNLIKQEKYEISETLKSKSFKLGKKLTKKKERLDYSLYNEYLK